MFKLSRAILPAIASFVLTPNCAKGQKIAIADLVAVREMEGVEEAQDYLSNRGWTFAGSQLDGDVTSQIVWEYGSKENRKNFERINVMFCSVATEHCGKPYLHQSDVPVVHPLLVVYTVWSKQPFDSLLRSAKAKGMQRSTSLTADVLTTTYTGTKYKIDFDTEAYNDGTVFRVTLDRK